MKIKQYLSVAIALSSIAISAQQAQAVQYSFNNAIPNLADPLSMSGFFDIDDTLGSIPGEVEWGSELTDWSLEISSSTAGVPSTTLTSSNSAIEEADLFGVTLTSTKLDFSTATEGFFCISTSNCETTATSGEADFVLVLNPSNNFDLFALDLGAEPDANFQNLFVQPDLSVVGYAEGSFTNFPPQISSAPVSESSPTLGLIVAGSLFGLARYRRSCVKL